MRGESDDSLRSRVAALGWSGHGSALVMVGTTETKLDDVKAAELRRATRRAVGDSLVGIQADRVVLVLGGVLGAAVGNSIGGHDDRRHYGGRGYASVNYHQPAPVYVQPRPVYVQERVYVERPRYYRER